MKRIRVAGIVLSFALAVPFLAQAALTKASGASVTFFANGTAGLKIEGKTSELSVEEKPNAIKVKVALAQLETGISLRNKHLREKYLEVEKYPEAVLEVDKAQLKLPSQSQGEVKGMLTLHGQTKPVTVKYTAAKSKDGYAVQGSFPVDIREFGIEVPSYLGVSVKPEVNVTASFAAQGEVSS